MKSKIAMVITITVSLFLQLSSLPFASASTTYSVSSAKSFIAGTTTIKNSDGSVTTTSIDAQGRRSMVETEVDGTISTLSFDGSLIIKNPNGSTYSYSAPNAKGERIYTVNDGVGPIEQYASDSTTFYFPGNSVQDTFLITGVGKFVDKATQFTVQRSEGNLAVCGMEYNGTVLKVAPWTFTFNPSTSVASNDPTINVVTIDYCFGGSDTIPVDVAAPFTLDKFFFNGDTNPQAIFYLNRNRVINIANYTNEDISAILTDDAGKTIEKSQYLANATGFTGQGFLFTLPKAHSPLDHYLLTVSSKSYSIGWPVYATSNWSLLDEKEGGTFKPCSTITWIYLPKKSFIPDTLNAPKTATDATVLSDIKIALAVISAHGSVKFVYSTDSSLSGKPGVITYDWKNLGGAAGIGGPHYNIKDNVFSPTDYSGTYGEVSINPNVSWGANDLYKGFGTASSPEIIKANKKLRAANDGRAWLFAHETIHVLGIDHSVDRNSLMYYLGGHSSFTKADLFALNYLYPACKA